MSFSLKIKFSKSSSKLYDKVLELCNCFSDFSPISENNKANCLSIDLESFNNYFNKIDEILKIIKNWKSSEIAINNKSINYMDLFPYKEIIKCSTNKTNTIGNDNYCFLDSNIFEGWGCKKLQSIKRYINEGSNYYAYNSSPYYSKYWFEFGKFNENGIWIINKNIIIERLIQETNNKNLPVCKYFNIDKITEIVNNLPDEIDIENSDKWEYVVEEIDNGITVQKVNKSIIPIKLKNDNSSSKINLNNIYNNSQKNNEICRNIPDVKFSDIGGLDDLVQTIREIIELPIKKPEIFKYLRINPHKGILLFGEPGCGKTMIAKAIANEVKAHFISIKGPELLSKWHGQSEENLRRIFEEAGDLEPSIIFFDEIDSIAQSRSSEENLRIDSKFVNQLLTLMDGVENFGNIKVLASTNRPELLDKALLRPGRFDYCIEIKKPTQQGCNDIFEILTKEMPICNNFNKSSFIKKMFGLTGADISFIVTESAYNCLRRNIDLASLIHDTDIDINLEQLTISEDDFNLALKKYEK